MAAVIDLVSRRVADGSMQGAMTAQLVAEALMMAIWRRGRPHALLNHADEVSHYTSERLQKLMADDGVACSMSRSGNVWGSATLERFFSSLKTERTVSELYRPRNQARADVFDYIELFSNPRRRHATIGYLRPIGVRADRRRKLNTVSTEPAAAHLPRTGRGGGEARSGPEGPL